MELPTTRKLHDYIDRHFYKSLYIFPLVAASTWFVTITTLLIRWLTMGRPRYPGQYNPDIPLISDIAAFTFKPVFVIGGTLTGLAYFMTVLAVHHVRYSPKFYGPTNSDPDNVTEAVMEPWWRKAASGVALVAGLGAATCLVLLSVFDTYDSKVWHRNFLMGTFLGLAVSAIALVVVWWDHTSCVGAPPSRLRFW
jgi:hypothetical protein